MKSIQLILSLLIILISNLQAQVSINGYAYLSGQTEHDSVLVIFEQTAPSNTIDTVYTDEAGYYQLSLDYGYYTITYKKNGFYPEQLIDIELIVNQTIDNVYLIQDDKYLLVPNSFSTIQSAINAAYNNDTILVLPGIYYEKIDFQGKGITIISNYLFTKDTSDISSTIIDGENNGRVVNLTSDESGASLNGFTIQNGHNIYNDINYGQGGGIVIKGGTSILLENLIIVNNQAYEGGGIYIYNSSPTLNNLSVHNNNADRGGGIFTYSSGTVKLKNSRIFNNTNSGINNYRGSLSIFNTLIFNNTSSRGGGIENYAATSYIYNSTIDNNTSTGNGGGIIQFGGALTLYNSIVSNNKGSYGIYLSDSDPVDLNISYSNVWNNQAGNFFNCGDLIGQTKIVNLNNDSCDLYRNFSMDPVFDNSGNYSLDENSPCIDAGNNNMVEDLFDLNGNSRVVDGDQNGTATVDMGAIEFGSGFSLGPDKIACENIYLSVYGKYSSYNWNNGLSYDDSLYVDSSGLYYLEAVDSLGTSHYDTVHVTIIENPEISLGNDTTVCGELMLSIGGDYTQYKWNDNQFFGDPLLVKNSGEYFAQVTDTNYCSFLSDTINITVLPMFREIEATDICIGDSVLWRGLYYHETGYYSEHHSSDFYCDSIYALLLNVHFPTNQVDYDTLCIGDSLLWEGEYYSESGKYERNYTSVHGCDSLKTLYLTFVPVPDASITSPEWICQTEEILISCTYPDTANYKISWDFDGATILSGTNPGPYVITWDTVGNKYITLTAAQGKCVHEEGIWLDKTPSSGNIAICLVGVNAENKNRVYWEHRGSQSFDSVFVYKETSQSDVYEKIGKASYKDENYFVDMHANPVLNSSRYKISLLDTCGNETPQSAYHKTMHLTINAGINGGWNLIWDSYEGFEYATFNIYRGNENNEFELISEQPSNTFTYTDPTPPAGTVYYQIEVVKTEPCISPSMKSTATNYQSSLSNIASSSQASTVNDKLSNTISLFPNPIKDKIYIKNSNGNEKIYLSVLTTEGKVLFSKTMMDSQDEIDFTKLSLGLYFIRIETSIGSRIYMVSKL
jgi:hypothetical protein